MYVIKLCLWLGVVTIKKGSAAWLRVGKAYELRSCECKNTDKNIFDNSYISQISLAGRTELLTLNKSFYLK